MRVAVPQTWMLTARLAVLSSPSMRIAKHLELTPTAEYFTIVDQFESQTRYGGVIYFQGPGHGPESRLSISAFDVGQGCEYGEAVEYQPDFGGSFFSDFAYPAGEPPVACGLTVTTATEAHFRGSFSGVVRNNGGSTADHTVDVTFDLEERPL